LALRRDAAIGGWSIVGDAEDLFLGKERREIIDLLRLDGPSTPKQVANSLNRNEGATRKLMAAMAKDGQLDNNGSGLYSLPAKINSGNSSYSSNYSNGGNSSNSDSKTANTRQSYLGFEPGNAVNDSYSNELGYIVTEVTPVTNDADLDEIEERKAIMEFDGNLSRAEAEALATAPARPGGRVPVEELFDLESKAA
jgi:hypothetical protein